MQLYLFQIHRPIGITTGYKTFKHNHNKHLRPRDMKSYNNQWRVKYILHLKELYYSISYLIWWTSVFEIINKLMEHDWINLIHPVQ